GKLGDRACEALGTRSGGGRRIGPGFSLGRLLGRSWGGHRQQRRTRRHRFAGAREPLLILTAARRPAPLLDAIGSDGQAARVGRQQETYSENAVLPAALDDVARLTEHGLASRIL